jgi:hypothetical protein
MEDRREKKKYRNIFKKEKRMRRNDKKGRVREVMEKRYRRKRTQVKKKRERGRKEKDKDK